MTWIACAACWPTIRQPRPGALNFFASLLPPNEAHRNETATEMKVRPKMKISVVIPVLNERDALPATVAALRVCSRTAESSVSESILAESILSEIIVSDGGSTDG